MKFKIKGQQEEGIVFVNNSNLMDVVRKGQKIGHVVVEYVQK